MNKQIEVHVENMEASAHQPNQDDITIESQAEANIPNPEIVYSAQKQRRSNKSVEEYGKNTFTASQTLRKEPSQISSELQDRIDDLVRAETVQQPRQPNQSQLKKQQQPRYAVQYSEENQNDEKLKSEMMDELGLDDEES